MSKTKSGFSKALYYTCPILATGSLTMVGFSSWLISKNDKISININAQFAELKQNGLNFSNVSFLSSSLNFDAYNLDDQGSIVSSEDTNEQLEIVLSGNINGFDADFEAIRINFRVEPTYKYIYESLINRGYIKEPTFNDLKKTDVTTSSIIGRGSFWTSDALSGTRSFFLSYTFEWGSLFNYKNPSLFFDSSDFNGIKKGDAYTSKEKKDILNELKALNGAKYNLYLDAYKANNTYKVILNSNGGKFSNIDTTTSITKDKLIDHDKIILPICFKDKSEFVGWSDGSNTYQAEEFLYIDQLFNNANSSEITLNAVYRDLGATGTLSFASGSNYSTANVEVFISSSRNGYISKAFSNNTGGTITEALIGDRIKIEKDSNVNTITYSGLSSPNAEGWQIVQSSSYSINIIPFEKVTVNFTYDTTGVTNPIANEFLVFSVSIKDISTTNYKGAPTSLQFGYGQRIKLNEIHGMESYSISGLTQDSDGYYILNTTSVNVTIKKKTSYNLILNKSGGSKTPTVNYTVTNDLGYSKGETGASMKTISYCLIDGDNITVEANTNCSSISPTQTTCSKGNVTINVTASSSTCITYDTLILMSDYSLKKAIDVDSGDEVIVFNHVKGKLDSAVVMFNEIEDESEYELIRLTFSDNITIDISFEHAFFDLELNKYIYINNRTYRDYLNHRFLYLDENNNIKYVTLLNTYIYNKITRLCGFVTNKHLNFFNNRLLSIEGNIDGLFNYFDLDEKHQIIKEKMEEDIKREGVFDYSVFEKYMCYEAYDAYNFKFLIVSLAKKMITWDKIMYLLERYKNFIN